MGSADWHPVLFPQTLCHFSKFRLISISWYRQLQILFVAQNIWREIGIGLQQIRVVDGAIKLILKVRVIFEVLGPVFRIQL